MSISRRGLLAVGLTAAVVGSIGVASMLNAQADDGTDGAFPAASVSAVPAEVGDVTTASDGTQVLVPPAEGPSGERPRRMKLGRVGASSAELAASGADAAPDNSLSQPRPAFGAKGETLGNRRAIRSQQITVVPADTPPAPPALRDNSSGAVSSNDAYYSYVYVGRDDLTSDGLQANLSIAKPSLAKGDYHTLAEIAAATAGNRQVVEVGWTVDTKMNGDADPHLFVYSWVDGAQQCYNSCNFIPAKGASIKPGDTLTVGVKAFAIQHTDGVWWIWYNSEWIGGFPDSVWNGKFTSAGSVKFYGEVASPQAQSCSQMGNGQYGTVLGSDGKVVRNVVDGKPLQNTSAAGFGRMKIVNPSPALSSTDKIIPDGTKENKYSTDPQVIFNAPAGSDSNASAGAVAGYNAWPVQWTDQDPKLGSTNSLFRFGGPGAC